jgi:hypothetical protein
VRIASACRRDHQCIGDQSRIFDDSRILGFQDCERVVGLAVGSKSGGGMVEGIEHDHLLAEGGPALGGDIGEFRLRVHRQHAAPVKEQVANQRDRFAAARAGDRQDMAVIANADQLVAKGADQDFSARIVRIVGQRLPLQNVLGGLPARLWNRLHPEIARRQSARNVLRKILDECLIRGLHRFLSRHRLKLCARIRALAVASCLA